jgi:hypothetical protein
MKDHTKKTENNQRTQATKKQYIAPRIAKIINNKTKGGGLGTT